MVVVFDIFVDAGVVEHFKMEERALMIWISRVASHYRDNPYHNLQHVVHVLHAVFLVLMTTEASKCLTRADQLALLIAALCHDIDHDGEPSVAAFGLECQRSSAPACCKAASLDGVLEGRVQTDGAWAQLAGRHRFGRDHHIQQIDDLGIRGHAASSFTLHCPQLWPSCGGGKEVV